MEVKIESIVLGGGCFWCLDAGYRLIKGVTSVISGFAAGQMSNPSYYDVVSGSTGHAEVVKIDFDANVLSLTDILDIFWVMHDPTTLNRQGNDVGAQYRSIILYTSQEQKKTIEESVREISSKWDKPIVTEIKELINFYPAEEEHQNYFQNNPEMAYCQVIINPKLNKLRAKFNAQLKTQ